MPPIRGRNWLYTLGLVLTLFLSTTVQAQTGHTSVGLDGRDIGTFPYLMSNGYLMLPLSAFVGLGWKPVLDPFHQTIDVLDCFRLDIADTDVYFFGGPPALGLLRAEKLENLPKDIQFVEGFYYLPVRPVLKFLNYDVTFDITTDQVQITSPSDLSRLTPTQENCLLNLDGKR